MTRWIQLPDFKLDGAVAEILVDFCHHGPRPSSTLILCYMDVLISSRRPPLHSLQWHKDFSVRQTTVYHGQYNRLRIPAGGVNDWRILPYLKPESISAPSP
jgi:hypothetical protein